MTQSFAKLEADLHSKFQATHTSFSPTTHPAPANRRPKQNRRKPAASKAAVPDVPTQASPEAPADTVVEIVAKVRVPLLAMSTRDATRRGITASELRDGYRLVPATSLTDVLPGNYTIVNKGHKGPKGRQIPTMFILYRGERFHTVGDADGNYYGARINEYGKLVHTRRFLGDQDALAAERAAAAAQAEAEAKVKADQKAKDQADAKARAEKAKADRIKAKADAAKAKAKAKPSSAPAKKSKKSK